MNLVDVATCLYRLFDREGRLLYVGITVSPGHRFAHHKAKKSWWPDVDSDRTALTLYDSRSEAADARKPPPHDAAGVAQGDSPQAATG